MREHARFASKALISIDNLLISSIYASVYAYLESEET